MTLNGDLLKVEYDDNDDITVLKKKIKEEKPNDYKNVDADHLIVWQYKEPKLLIDINVDELEDILHKIDFSDH